MKKILILIFLFNFSNAFASEFKTNFTNEEFLKAQNEGKTVVVYSWNKYCLTCNKQKKILKEAKTDFQDIIFLYIDSQLSLVSIFSIFFISAFNSGCRGRKNEQQSWCGAIECS